jgi:hypothetical protein
LKTGQHTLETRALTVPDPFSYTSGMGSGYTGEDVTRYFNLTHEWLAQIVMYLIYSATGFPGLVLARALMLIVLADEKREIVRTFARMLPAGIGGPIVKRLRSYFNISAFT